MSCLTGQILCIFNSNRDKSSRIKHYNPFKSYSNGPTERRRAIITGEKKNQLVTLK